MAKKLLLSRDLLEASRLPSRHIAYQVANYFGAPKALKQVEQFARKFDDAKANQVGLILRGPADSAKTFLAVHLCRLLMHRGFEVCYYTLDFVTDAYFHRTDDALSFLSRFEPNDLVVFDGLNETTHKGQKIAILKAINARSLTGKPFVICTTLDAEEFGTQYGPDLAKIVERDLVEVACSVSDLFAQHELNQLRKSSVKL